MAQSKPGIVNQMIIYLEHSHKCDTAYVLFADDVWQDRIVFKYESKKIYFLGFYPDKISMKQSLNEIHEQILLK